MRNCIKVHSIGKIEKHRPKALEQWSLMEQTLSVEDIYTGTGVEDRKKNQKWLELSGKACVLWGSRQ